MQSTDMTCIDLFVQLSARNQFLKMSHCSFKGETCWTLKLQMLKKTTTNIYRLLEDNFFPKGEVISLPMTFGPDN